MTGQTFKKEERLCAKRLIDLLFEKGSGFNMYPFRAVWLEAEFESPYPVQVMMVVPKKNFKKAVDRNRLKRLMREAYRKNKEELYEHLRNEKKKYLLSLVYTGKELLSYQEVEQKIILTLRRLMKINA